MIAARFARRLAGLSIAASLAAGCAMPAGPMPAPHLGLDMAEGLERLANSPTRQWSSDLVANAEVQRQRARLRGTDADRRVQSVTPNWSLPSAGFAGTGASGRISSAPSYFYLSKTCFWITESGWLLKYNTATNTPSAVLIPGGDTFPNTSLTISNDGRRAYAVSAQGRFHAIDTATGAHVSGSPVAMGGTSPNVSFGSPPFIDPLVSRPDGQEETIYTVTHSGVLHRFVLRNGGGIPSLTVPQTYALPVVNTAAHTEICRSAPVVLGGRVAVATWRRSTAMPYNHAADTGAFIYYDTQVRSTTTATTAGVSVRRVDVAWPLWAPPALDVDDYLTPTLAFLPAGTGAIMIDVATGNVAQSVPLAVDSRTNVSGSMAAYAYGTSGTSSVTKYPAAAGAATLNQSGAVDTANVLAARQVSTANTNQVFGYLKFAVADADVTIANALKVVTDARLVMRCNASSNYMGLYNPTPLRAFRVHNNMAAGLGAVWNAGNLAFASRPSHMDGAAFDQNTANLGAQSRWELAPHTTNVYVSGNDYAWPARGKIGSPNQEVSIGLVHTQLLQSPSLFGGILGSAAPRFLGGTTDANRPRLQLTLSNAGFTNPTTSAPVSTDSLNQQVFLSNTNALFKLSYAGAASAWVQRAASFESADQTFFALTRLGQDTDSAGNAGPLHGTAFVEGKTAPLFDGAYVYVQDHHPGYGR
ncbi:MAG: hypothetical protein ACK46X_18495, partial [Candidatus Sericytochromatia bacterium]